jgi:phosphoribosylanthranilate isomerase
MKIKVCGLKEPGNVRELLSLKPDYIGFICYEKSPRFIGGLEADLLINLPASVIKTGVFVNENAGEISRLIDRYSFDAIQLHGAEQPDFCGLFKGKVTVIKAFGVDETVDFSTLEPYRDMVDFFLFDTKTTAHGGSGRTFDWDILADYKLEVPFFLSGGLSLDNLARVKEIDHTAFYGVDLNSRFETTPGMKDIDKLKQAFSIIKSNETYEIRS